MSIAVPPAIGVPRWPGLRLPDIVMPGSAFTWSRSMAMLPNDGRSSFLDH
jgi:hypothetical protein